MSLFSVPAMTQPAKPGTSILPASKPSGYYQRLGCLGVHVCLDFGCVRLVPAQFVFGMCSSVLFFCLLG